MWSPSFAIVAACEAAITRDERTSRLPDDKEYHFQRWVEARIIEAGYEVPSGRRNSYPDFPIMGHDEAHEVKGISAGSREGDFDCNSQLPSGKHGNSDVFYVFGRYERVGETPRVLDIAIVHGDLLNAGPGFLADNKSMRVVGTYGDILLRDRKMYVADTPYRLITNIKDHCTLVAPAAWTAPPGFKRVGDFARVEADHVIVGYHADLPANRLEPVLAANPSAGKEHRFVAWRTELASDAPVTLVTSPTGPGV